MCVCISAHNIEMCHFYDNHPSRARVSHVKGFFLTSLSVFLMIITPFHEEEFAQALLIITSICRRSAASSLPIPRCSYRLLHPHTRRPRSAAASPSHQTTAATLDAYILSLSFFVTAVPSTLYPAKGIFLNAKGGTPA